MNEDQRAERENSVQSAYISWHHLLYDKLYNLEYFLLAVKSDIRAAGYTSAKADEFLENKITEIRRELRASRNKIYTRQR